MSKHYKLAHVTRRPEVGATKTAVEQITLMDGSMVLSLDDLKVFGKGDAEAARKQLRQMIYIERETPEVFVGPSDKPTGVRAANAADEAAIFDLLMEDVAENAATVALPSEERIRSQIEFCTRGLGGIAGVIDDPSGRPVAVCLMVPFQWWWSKEYAVQELVLYVHKDHRKSRHVHDLLQFQRWVVDTWTKSFGYRVYLLCGVLGVNRVFAKISLYRRRFRQAGAAFIYPSPFPNEVT